MTRIDEEKYCEEVKKNFLEKGRKIDPSLSPYPTIISSNQDLIPSTR